ncbi:PREDICTED: indole-3-acetic acid-amido synthetase GH3.17-like [Camelina sativa]|uniref:Indole-3-acetic acid-amido synthetase GH3.17-like n=1 Tax=Camelina sativa TaxID=90675 RepID=A0ABM1QTV2_CAMSA|nr:PREDICTED: indole-3-acetic acid-amido synthetase GH3.17-like [Camelina sativa]XP_010453407.1 PREDICTED: indole-3-acetic acid-amido synthetase GH3.17-like [Camelina sativa]XP_010453408.1 PREDICTED: indole-3-acetic acid-amido synthetase GH3.17-like [Camelina sativa]XP_019090190.1 PREDICTED: indole-3-acetic acid-amido synthetase GH3.17-like [Camelina sativa]XP_019090191.1 PREDICTED: indole-3-acetic acid-amido synthetase GH3.17-like [Camelina sativa]
MLPRFDPTNTEACLSLLEDVTTNVKQIQDSLLEAILSRNAQTEYLRGFLNGQVDKQSFKKNLPVVTYEDIRPYIDRIANNGEPSNVICDRPISVLLTSSGTSGGVPKLIPLTTEDLKQRLSFASLYRPLLYKHIEGIREGKSLMFYFVTRESETASGILVRTMLTCVLKSIEPANSYIWDQSQVSPHTITTCADTTQSMYCQLLCGLLQRDDVGRLGAPFASSFLKVIKFLEDHWPELCSNIRTARLSDWITDPQCISGMGKFLTAPNPELASLIEQECSKTSWEAIVTRLWPKAKCIEAVVTGTMAQYIPLVEFYSGGLPVISTFYGSSECFIGLNLNPLCKPCDVSYTIMPYMGYFEFLEVEKDHQETGHDPVEKNHVVVDLVDVKVDHDYEPVVTTFSGLYRYRVGDVLRVTGFYNNTPSFRFVGRQKVVLSIDMDKTYEEDLLKAVANAKLLLEPHGLMLMDFTSRVDSSSFPGHYVLYWELGSKVKDAKLEPDPNVMEECCFTIEESLDAVYRKGRKNDKNIGPLEIKVINPGAFDELMSLFLSRGSSVSQYKTPRSVTNEEALKILEANVVSKFFSRKTPSWELHELYSNR